MAQEFDYVVIGGGCMGASIAYHLAERKAGSVALLERNTFLGQESTGKCAGGVRAQFSTEVNTRLSKLSIEKFETFEQDLGHPLQFLQWGYLFVLPSDELVAAFRKSYEMWQRVGIEAEWLEPDAIAERFPYIEMEGIKGATFSQKDGFADPNDIVQGYAKAARKLGVTEITDCEVQGFERDASNRRIATIQTTQGEFIANKHVVLTTGAWTRKLANDAGVDVPIDPYRRQILVTKAFDQIPTPFPMTVDMGTGLYFHPESGGVLIGMSDNDEPVSFNEALNEEFSETMLMAAMERCPVLENAAINRGWAGLYEVTPDHHPVIDKLGHIENAFVCAGFSGHGLMHAPAAGIVTAEWLTEGNAKSVDISALSLARFSNPEALLSEANVI